MALHYLARHLALTHDTHEAVAFCFRRKQVALTVMNALMALVSSWFVRLISAAIVVNPLSRTARKHRNQERDISSEIYAAFEEK